MLEAQRAGRLPSVSAAVFRGEELAWSEAIGLADVEQGVEASPDTQYAVASITKTFTAASILQLRDEGKLDLEDPLSKHLPEAAHGTPTLRRMLAHASGLQREPPGRDLGDARAFRTRRSCWPGSRTPSRCCRRWRRGTTRTSPTRCSGWSSRGSRGRHSATTCRCGCSARSGSSGRRGARATDAALPYFVEPYSDAVRREPVLELGGKGGESGLYSTVGDLARWGAFLCDPDESVLAASSVAEMHDLNVMAEADWTRGWGLGLELWRRGERIFGGHTGGFPGFLSILAYSRRDRVGAIMLTNTSDWPKLSTTGLELAEAALEELAPEPEPWTPEEAPPPEIASMLGRWWSEGSEMIFSWRRGKLEARLATWRPSASRRCSSARATTASASSRAASAASRCGSSGTRAARSCGSTGRRIRSRARPRSSAPSA